MHPGAATSLKVALGLCLCQVADVGVARINEAKRQNNVLQRMVQLHCQRDYLHECMPHEAWLN